MDEMVALENMKKEGKLKKRNEFIVPILRYEK